MSFRSTPAARLACLSIPLITAAHAADALSTTDSRLNQALGAHIEFLAHDLLEGRGTGTPGHEIAARYVAAQFAQWGLRPAGDSNTWFQTVPLMESRVVPDSATFELRVGDTVEALTIQLDYLPSPRFDATESRVTAPLVFAGFGVRAPELQYDDFAGLDLRGAIAVILAKAPPRFPATALAHHANQRQKSQALVDHGAVGVITVPTPKDLEEFPWPRRVMQSKFPSMRWLHADGTPANVFPQLVGAAAVSPQGAGRIFEGAPETLESVLAGAARSEPPRFAMGRQATLEVRSEHRRLTSVNVLGMIPGADPALAGESVVFTAHLDHQGVGPEVAGDPIYNGAYDNAIGVAMMLEIARQLATVEPRPRRSVVFAAVTGEEKGLLGSEYLATHWPAGAGSPVANLNLDMVLVTAPTRRYTLLGMEHSTLRTPVEAAAARWDLELVPDPRPERVTFVRSDQYSFVRQGVPALFPKVADSESDPATASADGLSPEAFVRDHYHRPSDDASLPRDAATAVRFVHFITDLARQVADAPEAPRWNPGDFFGETFARPREDR
ncbi:MAG: M20/M25/M40 family metallo-hydrolase [Verrucomicrobiae bacterium]|nr:M20/M25/M40 family metallo-hydrolase [Verrucomicrobiae bacterium]